MSNARRPRYRPRFCGSLGLQRAARKVIADGNAGCFTEPADWQQWIASILDGDTPDTLFDADWRNCCGTTYCRRARACKRDLRHGSG